MLSNSLLQSSQLGGYINYSYAFFWEGERTAVLMKKLLRHLLIAHYLSFFAGKGNETSTRRCWNQDGLCASSFSFGG